MSIITDIGSVVDSAGEAIGSAANSLLSSLQNKKSVDIAKYIPTTKMAYFYSPIDNKQMVLDAVTNVSYTCTGEATQSPVESGKTITDNYRVLPRTASFSGIIADTKVKKNDPISVVDYTIAVETAMALKEPFTFYCDDLLMPNIINCLITSFSISRDQSIGIGVAVDISIQEVLIVDRAKPTTINAKKGSSGTNAKNKTDKPSDSKGDGQTSEMKKSRLAATFDALDAARQNAEKALKGSN